MRDAMALDVVKRLSMFQECLDDAPAFLKGVAAFAISGDTLTHCAIGLTSSPDEPLGSEVRFRTYRHSAGRVTIEGSGRDPYPDYRPEDTMGSRLHIQALAKAYALVNAAGHGQDAHHPVRIDQADSCEATGSLHISPATGDPDRLPAWNHAMASWARDLDINEPDRLRNIMTDTVIAGLCGDDGSMQADMVARLDGDDLYTVQMPRAGNSHLVHWYFDQLAAITPPTDGGMPGICRVVMPCVEAVDKLPVSGDPIRHAMEMIDGYVESRNGRDSFLDHDDPANIPVARPGVPRLFEAGSRPSMPNVDRDVATWILDHPIVGQTDGAAGNAGRVSGAAYVSGAHSDDGTNKHYQRRNIMPMTQQVMRGNLAADPKYWPASTREDGRERQAYAEAIVYRNRRVRLDDGSYTDAAKGPEKVAVRFFGRDADDMNAAGFKSGDPVVATGSLADPDAYVDKAGEARARTVINGESLSLDNLRIAGDTRRAEQRQRDQEYDDDLANSQTDDPWANIPNATQGAAR